MAGLLISFDIPGRRMLLSLMGFVAALIVFHQFWVFPAERYLSDPSPREEASLLVAIRNSPPSAIPIVVNNFDLLERVDNKAGKLGEAGNGYKASGVASDNGNGDNDFGFGKDMLPVKKFSSLRNGAKLWSVVDSSSNKSIVDSHNVKGSTDSSAILSPNFTDSKESISTMLNPLAKMNVPKPSVKIKQAVELEDSRKNDSLMLERYVRKMRGPTITLSAMKSMLLNSPTASTSLRRKMSSPRDRELVSASLQIKNAPVFRNFLGLHAPIFRNASAFIRSHELMTRLLKIYVYKEGERPIFHQPRVRGIYAAEGWFMKLLEKSKQFVVKDPKKAHLFYLPFSSNVLRNTLHDHSMKDLEQYLFSYLELIKKKHHFWNRTGGADHFLVACHDWGPRITRTHMSNCIRALCNTNIARGFSIGKDVSVPVTYVRSGNEPTRDIGGKPSSERNTLAFFAGQMHGYVRPLLLKYWENKEPDMKIFGPMQRDVEGKAVYREYMKGSKFCVCARGYGVHTPRVVESIFFECVPVIISDNYVPPFFDVLDWEAFAVFVLEKDIPNLRNILLSIPEEKYFEMHLRVKMVQRHFIWHKFPEKYDLFHMILHSIWYSRVSQLRLL